MEFAGKPLSDAAARPMTEGTSGFASSATRPRRAAHGSRSASAAKDVALAALATAPPALTRRTLHLSRLQRASARVSKSRAAVQIRVRRRRFKMLRTQTQTPFPSGCGRETRKNANLKGSFRANRFRLR